ncbi:hypothetical protein NPIL_484441 [Nephila pilipes]|uniref:Uncharacterized protein n=1 Tax=Nephila pilipes TaxID=299642 RepID=A0A8X6PXX6_NEPPI|nr:hypothetical protein NPIL_484441 [Nephila pilipes]
MICLKRWISVPLFLYRQLLYLPRPINVTRRNTQRYFENLLKNLLRDPCRNCCPPLSLFNRTQSSSTWAFHGQTDDRSTENDPKRGKGSCSKEEKINGDTDERKRLRQTHFS